MASVAKIRGVKPEFWSDEDIVELSIPARLLFIGMWNFACDNGHLADKPRQIKMRVFPADNIDVEPLLQELEALDRIRREDGTITIRKFAHHQRPNKKWWATCDLPTCERPANVETPKAEATTKLANVGPSGPTSDGDGEGDGDGENKRAAAAAAAAEFEDWWQHYPAKRDKPKALEAFKKARKKISLDKLTEATIQYAKWLQATGTSPKYAQGWLNSERWTEDFSVTASPTQPTYRSLPVAGPNDW